MLEDSDMMKLLSKIWLKSSFLFYPVQRIFNGNFWVIFSKHFGDFSGKTVLDLACGTGDLRRYIKPKTYIGVDINLPYIQKAQKIYHQNNTTFLNKDITKFTPSIKFDVIFLVGSAHHLSDEQLMKTLKLVKRCRPSQFILCDGYPRGFLKGLLWWLDDVLGGGKYFRGEKELLRFVKKEFKEASCGVLYANWSLYKYPYVYIES